MIVSPPLHTIEAEVEMPNVEMVECANCGRPVEKPVGEVTRSRKLGRPMFCGLSCSAKHRNATRKVREFEMTCPCGKVFTTTTHNKAKRHCLRSCASRFSMSPARRAKQRTGGFAQKGNLISTQEMMKRREAWKYALLLGALADRPHEFEFKLGSYIYDLALLDEKVLVEFDGPEHTSDRRTRKQDKEKDSHAAQLGWRVERRKVENATVIHPKTIEAL